MSDETLERLRRERGHVLPVHEMLNAVHPSVLDDYVRLSKNLLFADEPHSLDLKTRYLVLVGITTAVGGDPDGIVWSSRRARENGATDAEIIEAACLAALPGGMPVVEAAAAGLAKVGIFVPRESWPE